MKKLLLTLFVLSQGFMHLFAGPLTLYVSRVHQAGCDNQSGIIRAYASGGNGTYTYKWNTGSTSDTIFNLSAATYRVTVTSGGDSATDQENLPAFNVDTALWHSACNGLDNGWVRFNYNSLRGETFPYHVQWFSNNDSLLTDDWEIDSLAAGTYKWFFTDAGGCVDSGSVSLGQSTPPDIEMYVSDSVLCWGEGTPVWFTPGFRLYYGGDYYGNSADTFFMQNSFGGSTIPNMGIDSAGCEAYVTHFPNGYSQGHPQTFYLNRQHDTIYLSYLSTAYDSLTEFDWYTPSGDFVTHYRYMVIDTPGNYWCMERNQYGCVVGSSSQHYFIFTSIDGVDEDSEGIKLFPNPANDETVVTVSSNDIGKHIQLYDLYGKLLTESTLQQATFSLFLQAYRAGLYFVKIGEHTKRLIKQ